MAGRSPDITLTPGLAALQAARDNPRSRFNDGAGGAAARLKGGGPVAVHGSPKFRLSRADSVFTMGSCFARNVEYALAAAGVRVLPEKWAFPPEFMVPEAERRAKLAAGFHRHVILRSVLNKYTPASMLDEFQRALAPETCRAPHKGLVHIDEDRWFDPHAKDTGLRGLQESLMVRHLVEEASKSVLGAGAIFLTLGLTETWIDTETGMVLNVAPPPLLIRKWPERFQFFNADHAQALDALERIRELVARCVRPDMKFIVTVSPVPLNTTFTGQDVIAANTYSKAVLRAAAQAFCARHETADYFPSYEMVMSAPADVAWEADRMHVPQPLVEFITARFVSEYFTDMAPHAAARPVAAPA